MVSDAAAGGSGCVVPTWSVAHAVFELSSQHHERVFFGSSLRRGRTEDAGANRGRTEGANRGRRRAIFEGSCRKTTPRAAPDRGIFCAVLIEIP